MIWVSPLIVSPRPSPRSSVINQPTFLSQPFGLPTGVNRLDRLTSGLMILAMTGKASTGLAQEFINGHVRKEYIARVRGEFPESVRSDPIRSLSIRFTN